MVEIIHYDIGRLIMGDYCTPLRGIMEITPTEGRIMCPEGCILPQRDAVDRRSRHPEGAECNQRGT